MILTEAEKNEALKFFNKAYSICGWHISLSTHMWIAKVIAKYAKNKTIEKDEVIKSLKGALESAKMHLEFCNYGDPYERDSAKAWLPEKIEKALKMAE